MTDPITFEERLAHLIRAVDDLSDIVARQEREIAALARNLAWLTAREAERADAPPADTPPPHW